MTKDELELEIMHADLAIRRQQAELLKAQARMQNAEAARIESIVEQSTNIKPKTKETPNELT